MGVVPGWEPPCAGAPVTLTIGTASQPHLQGQVVGVLRQVPRGTRAGRCAAVPTPSWEQAQSRGQPMVAGAAPRSPGLRTSTGSSSTRNSFSSGSGCGGAASAKPWGPHGPAPLPAARPCCPAGQQPSPGPWYLQEGSIREAHPEAGADLTYQVAQPRD